MRSPLMLSTLLALSATACRAPARVAHPLAAENVSSPFVGSNFEPQISPPRVRSTVAATIEAPPNPTPAAPTTEQAAVAEGPRSKPLPSGWHNPMPGGYIGGYAADTGLDIAGFKLPVHAVASGTVVYAEPGHTGWTGRGNTNLSVLLELDEPVPWGERQITHAWYAHLSHLAFIQDEGVDEPRHVAAGEQLGISGFGNGSPHLHLGLLLDGGVEQHWGDFLLFDQVADVLGPYRLRQRLPLE